MSAIKLTLQNRITSLMIIFSVLLISVFTIIQLNNQISNINRYNSYQANLTSVIVKNNLESLYNQATLNSLNAQEVINTGFKAMKETNLIKGGIVFDRDGNILASTNKKSTGQIVSYKELNSFDKLERAFERENRIFIHEINEATHQLDVLIPIKDLTSNQIVLVSRIYFPLGNIQEALLLVYKPVIISTLIILLLNILFGYFLSKTVIGPIKVLNEVTTMIARGNLSIRTNIATNDELQNLGETFNFMAQELIKMKERAENANPLTKLPGNMVIREEIEKRINQKKKFMVIYCDLDNFKAFNDKYGIGKGDEAISITAAIFKEAASKQGNKDDFIGHEGGDDFLLLTSPEKANDLANYITSEFDKRIRSLYSAEDLQKGFIEAHARDGSVKNFPIMSISLAGVTNLHRPIESYGQVTNIAAEVKKKAKAEPGSVFIIDRRIE